MKIKLLRIIFMMSKYTFSSILIICALAGVLLASNGNAQKASSIREVLVDIKVTNSKLSQVLTEIEAKTDFNFAYDKKDLKAGKKINLDYHQASVAEVLLEISKVSNLKFRQINNFINISKRKNSDNGLVEVSIELETEISGKVTDESGEGLPGATIVVKGSSVGTTTDLEGNYKLTVPDDALITISFVGYKTLEIPIVGRSTVDVQMELDAEQLDEIVIVGYGNEKKRNLTSSVATVEARDIQEIPSTSLSNAISGRIPGVRVSQPGGKPGRSSDIVVRGATTGGFAGSSSPLYVIDGIIANKELFDLLDATEVDKVTVLKDAASAAVYGARAANGVILVTTKNGKKGKPVIEFTSSWGTTSPSRRPETVSPFESATLHNRRIELNAQQSTPAQNPQDNPDWINDAEMAYLQNTDYGTYLDQLSNSPILQRYAINVSGASDRVNYFMSGSYVTETGTFDNLEYTKFNLRGKVAADVTDDLNVALNLSAANDYRDEFYWRWNGSNEDFGDFYRTANRSGKFTPAFIDGKAVANFNGWNAANIIDRGQGRNERRSINTNTTISLTYKPKFVKGLTGTFSYNRIDVQKNTTNLRTRLTSYTFGTVPGNRFELTNEVVGTRVRTDDGADSNSLSESQNTNGTYQMNFGLAYDKTFGDHRVNAFFNYEQWELNNRNFFIRRRNLVSPEVIQLNVSDTDIGSQYGGGATSEDGRLSYIGGIGYTLRDKYIFNATFRYDGSTRFIEGERYGFFPSASAAWILSEEDFIRNSMGFVDFLKLRFSAGRSGNDDPTGSGVNGYFYEQTFGLSGGGAILGVNDIATNAIGRSGQANPNITWEIQDSYNLGMDFQILDRKIDATLDFFLNKKSNLFGSRQAFVAEETGLVLAPENYGKIDIKGFDIQLTYSNKINQDFGYYAGFNLGYAVNKYVELDEPESRRPHDRLLGHSTDRLRGTPTGGIIRTQEQLDALISAGYKIGNRDPRLGELILIDRRGNSTDDPDGNTPDGIADGNDQEYIGSHSNAPFNYGMSLGLNWKGFTLDIFLQGLAGHQRFDPAPATWTFSATGGHTPWTQWLDAYDPVSNPNGSLPSYQFGYGTNYSYALRNAGFIRLKNVNLKYSIPNAISSRIGIRNASIFLNGTNLLLLQSSIKTYDPEVEGSGIPVNKSYSLGLRITL